MKKIQLEGGGMPELLNPTSNVTRLSQMTPNPLGLQIPSGALEGGGQGGEVSSAARLPGCSFSNASVSREL